MITSCINILVFAIWFTNYRSIIWNGVRTFCRSAAVWSTVSGGFMRYLAPKSACTIRLNKRSTSYRNNTRQDQSFKNDMVTNQIFLPAFLSWISEYRSYFINYQTKWHRHKCLIKGYAYNMHITNVDQIFKYSVIIRTKTVLAKV